MTYIVKKVESWLIWDKNAPKGLEERREMRISKDLFLLDNITEGLQHQEGFKPVVDLVLGESTFVRDTAGNFYIVNRIH